MHEQYFYGILLKLHFDDWISRQAGIVGTRESWNNYFQEKISLSCFEFFKLSSPQDVIFLLRIEICCVESKKWH